jgi:hypothetical protein
VASDTTWMEMRPLVRMLGALHGVLQRGVV